MQKINKLVLDTAKNIAIKLSSEEIRKRVFVLSTAAMSVSDLLDDGELKLRHKNSLFKITSLSDAIEIADIYTDNVKIDVRVIYDGMTFYVPKSHEKFSATPDIYLVVRMSKNIENIEPIGFIESLELLKIPTETDYYEYSTGILRPLEELKSTIEKINIKNSEKIKNISFTKEIHEKIEELAIAFLDNQISDSEKVFFIQHLMQCPFCREKLSEMNEFDNVVGQLNRYPDLLNDQTLDILTGALARAYSLPEAQPVYIPEEEDIIENQQQEQTELSENTIEIINEEIPSIKFDDELAEIITSNITDGVKNSITTNTIELEIPSIELTNETSETQPEILNNSQTEEESCTITEKIENNEEDLLSIVDENTLKNTDQEEAGNFAESFQEEQEQNIEINDLDISNNDENEIINEVADTIPSLTEENTDKLESDLALPDIDENVLLETTDDNSTENILETTVEDNDLIQHPESELNLLEESSEGLTLDLQSETSEKLENIDTIDSIDTNNSISHDELLTDEIDLSLLEDFTEENIVIEEENNSQESQLENSSDTIEESAPATPMPALSAVSVAFDQIPQMNNDEKLNDEINNIVGTDFSSLVEENTDTEDKKTEENTISDVSIIPEQNTIDSELENFMDDDILSLLSDDDEESDTVKTSTPIQNNTPSSPTESSQSEKPIEVLFEENSKVDDSTKPITVEESPVIKSAVSKTKNAVIVLFAALILLAGGASTYFMKIGKFHKPVDSDDNSSDSNSLFDFANKPTEPEAEAPVPQDINKSMTNVFSEKPTVLTITKISWNVNDKLAQNDAFKNYLQVAGKNLQMNLQNDLVNTTEFAYNNKIQLNFQITKDNEIKNLQVLDSSGSEQIDNVVLRSIKETLKYINAPNLKDIKGDYNLSLIINF